MTYRPNAPLPAATTTQIGGVKPDGTTITTAADGTASVVGVSVSSLADVSTLGGPTLTDVEVVNRAGSDYRTTLGENVTLFRRTPAGSRTVTLVSGATTVSLTAADHDKTVVVTGSVAGSLGSDGTATDGFRCHVINHSNAALGLSGLAGLQGATSIPIGSAAMVTLSAAALEVAPLGGGSTGATAGGTSGQVQVNNGGSFAGITISGDATLNTTSGALSVTKTNGTAFGGAATLNVGTSANTVAAGNDSRLVGALQSNAIPAASGQLLGGSGTAGAATSVTIGTGLSLSGGVLTGVASTGTPVTTVTSSGTTQTLSFPANGTSAFDITLTGNCTFTISGGAAGQWVGIVLVLRGGSGGFAATLPAGIRWPGGTAPTFDTSAGAVNLVHVSTPDAGTTLIGSY